MLGPEYQKRSIPSFLAGRSEKAGSGGIRLLELPVSSEGYMVLRSSAREKVQRGHPGGEVLRDGSRTNMQGRQDIYFQRGV